MKKVSWESILFLTVGTIAAGGGLSWFIGNDFRNASGWTISWNLFRLALSVLVIILGFKGFFLKKK